jgi:hypothetical protein
MILLITESGVSSMIGGIEGEPALRDLYALIMTDMIEVPGNGFTVNGEEIQFVVDEEGKIKERGVNAVATSIYDSVLTQDPRGLIAGRDTLNGPVVVLTGKHLLK